MDTQKFLSQPFAFVALAFSVLTTYERREVTHAQARKQMAFLYRHCPAKERGGVGALWRGMDDWDARARKESAQ